MNLQFLNARNGQQTCSADGRYLHSSFNPEIEAERFIQSVSCTFEPEAVVLSGACLPWCLPALKEKFPSAKLIVSQYDVHFEPYSAGWDQAFFITNSKEAQDFSASLFNLLGEEKLMTTLFLSWKPSETVWPDESRLFWEATKACMEKAQSVLTTRNWFNLRWFKNTVRNLSSIHHYSLIEKTDLPVVVTASGPSLTTALPFLKANRNSFCLIAASSSISTLLANDIIPDACISTDGGWYATRHLRCYQTDERLKNVPLIISAESAVPASLYAYVPFVLLSYGDAIETLLIDELKLPVIKGLRNGTVSGTAAALASSLTSGKVYLCGLDLAPGKGFQHAEPNENDVPLFAGQTRLRSVETSQTASRFSSGSLSLYREWFSTQGPEFTSRIFRLISENDDLEPLGTMKDVFIEKLFFPKQKSNVPENFCVTSIAKPYYDAASDSGSNIHDRIRSYLYSAASFIENHPEDKANYIWFSTLAIKTYINWLRMSRESRQTGLTALVQETISGIKEVASHV